MDSKTYDFNPELIIIAEFAQPESGDHNVIEYLFRKWFYT